MKEAVVIKSTKLVAFDVDETLILWNPDEIDPERILPRIIFNGVPVLAHSKHIELMSQFAARGHTVMVWSKGGWQWAQKVVTTLGIESLACKRGNF